MLKRPMCLIGLAVVLIVYLFMHIIEQPALTERTGVQDGQYVFLTGQVSHKEIKNGKSVVYLRKATIQQPFELSHETHSIIAYLTEAAEVRLGSTIAIEGKLRMFAPAENEGQFDAARYYAINAVDFSVTKAYIKATSEEHDEWKEALYQCRERLKAVYTRLLPEKEAGIMHALLLGDKSTLDEDIKDLYMRAGIVHILSLSGVKMLLLALMKQSLNRTNTAFIAISCGDKYIIIQYILSTIMRCCRSHSIRGVIFKKYDLAKGIYYLA